MWPTRRVCLYVCSNEKKKLRRSKPFLFGLSHLCSLSLLLFLFQKLNYFCCTQYFSFFFADCLFQMLSFVERLLTPNFALFLLLVSGLSVKEWEIEKKLEIQSIV